MSDTTIIEVLLVWVTVPENIQFFLVDPADWDDRLNDKYIGLEGTTEDEEDMLNVLCGKIVDHEVKTPCVGTYKVVHAGIIL